MKPVTQDRILSALNKLSARTHNNKVAQQMQVFALHGLKSFTGSLQPVDNDKLDLELALIAGDRPTNPKEFSAKFDRLLNIHHRRQSKILDIQVNNKVSGLEWRHIDSTLVSSSFHFLFFNDILRPIPSDMQLLAKHKPHVVQHWIDFAVVAGLTVYQEVDDTWEPVAINWIWTKSSEFDWATISLDRYYLSSRAIETQGFDTRRSKPKNSDDEMYIEFHLTIGRGEDCDSINADILWFCAANHVPSM